MQNSMNSSFEPEWSCNTMKTMNDEELVRQYCEIKESRNLIDVFYLNEICARNLLDKID